jgi:HAD superfamily hydrolase (TIGR01484 family)
VGEAGVLSSSGIGALLPPWAAVIAPAREGATKAFLACRDDARATRAALRSEAMTHCPAMNSRPQALALVPRAQWSAVRGVFTDIDDTLTRDGAIEPVALAALNRLQQARIPVIAVTGRPLGWSEPFARAWPVAAIVPENGALALIRDGDVVRTEYAQDAATRARNAQRLREVVARVLAEVPGATPARDSAGRVTDIAIDHSEFATLNAGQIEQVVRVMRDEGMTATVSSIHVNGWFGDHDKLSGARWMLRRLYSRELDAERERWVYVGDSTNDQAMFDYFPLSVGVANLRRFASQLTTWPAFLTEGERGAGFAEVAQHVIEARA